MSADEAELVRLYRRVRDEPRSTAFVGLGDALRRANRLDEAMQVLREGFRNHPDHPAGRVVLARIHAQLGNRALACEIVREVVERDVDNLAAISLGARLLVELGRDWEARPMVARLRAAGHPDADLPVFRALSEPAAAEPARAPGGDPFAGPWLASRLGRKGRYARARARWQALLDAQPESRAARRGLAEVTRAASGDGEPAAGVGAVVSDVPLPGAADALEALLDDAADRPPPEGGHPVARWGRSLWRNT